MSLAGVNNATAFSTPARETQTFVRLDEDQLRLLESQLAGPIVTTATTELLAGYQLGIQTTLMKLRAGFVVGS